MIRTGFLRFSRRVLAYPVTALRHLPPAPQILALSSENAIFYGSWPIECEA